MGRSPPTAPSSSSPLQTSYAFLDQTKTSLLAPQVLSSRVQVRVLTMCFQGSAADALTFFEVLVRVALALFLVLSFLTVFSRFFCRRRSLFSMEVLQNSVRACFMFSNTFVLQASCSGHASSSPRSGATTRTSQGCWRCAHSCCSPCLCLMRCRVGTHDCGRPYSHSRG